MGSIGLPLSARDARLIIDNASQAPYGHNEQTIVNPDVRDTWEINADKITTQNPDWEAFLKDTVVPSVLQALGMQVAAPVCELYKLLLYQEGSQCVLGFFYSSIFIIPRTCGFHPHQDTANGPGMFATIVILLPSVYTGGQVHVSHNGTSQVYDFASKSATSTAILAWYTDVVHEVKRVTSGYRLALTYNLMQTSGGPVPALPDTTSAAQNLRRLLRGWRHSSDTIVYVPKHTYSIIELRGHGLSALKGEDQHKAMYLLDAAAGSGYEFRLGSLQYHQSGQPDDDQASLYYEKRGRYDEYYYPKASTSSVPKMSVVETTTLTVSNTVDSEGDPALGVDLTTKDLTPVNPFRGQEPDRKEYEGYMGNYAGSMDYYYRRTVLIIINNASARS